MSAPLATVATAAAGITERIRALAERPASVTVGELIEKRMATYAGRQVSMVYMLATWKALLGAFTLERLDADVMHAARAELAKLPALTFKGKDHEGRRIYRPKRATGTKSPATLNRYMAAISGLFTWAMGERLTPRGWSNPCRQVKRLPGERERVRFLDEEERDRLLAACKAQPARRGARYPRLYALVLMAMLTGARKGELLALKWADVDLAEGVARLRRSKNGDRRTLVLLPQVVEALKPFESADGKRYVFGSPRTRCTTPANIDTAWRKAIARAQIADFRFHDLRHTCASYMAQAGVDLAVVADVLGHRQLAMTRRYAHLKTETKAKAMQMALGSIGVGST